MTQIWTAQNGRLVRRVASGPWTPTTLQSQAGLQDRPSGSGYVRYEDVYVSGDTLQQTCNRVPADSNGNPQVLTLPEGTITISDFLNGNYDGVRIGTAGALHCKGIIGSGRNTIIRIAADSATRSMKDKNGNLTYFAGNILCATDVNGAIFSNFQLQGAISMDWTSTQQLYYAGIMLRNCDNARISWMYLRGASPGFANAPPGETFGINVYISDNVTISDTEVDGRATNGTRICASPFGWNGGGSYPNISFAQNAKVYRTYVHHGRASMPTFWETQNIYSEDLWSFSTGSSTGSLSGHAINHEQCKGPVYHLRPYMFTHGPSSSGITPPAPLPNDAVTDNGGFNFSLLTTIDDIGATTTIMEPVWDKCYSGSGLLIMNANDGYKGGSGGTGSGSALVTPPKVIKNGVQLQCVNHPSSGWNGKDPTQWFAWVH